MGGGIRLSKRGGTAIRKGGTRSGSQYICCQPARLITQNSTQAVRFRISSHRILSFLNRITLNYSVLCAFKGKYTITSPQQIYLLRYYSIYKVISL